MDWFGLLAVQGTLESLLQCHSSKASILQCSAFFMVQLSHPYMTTGYKYYLTGCYFKFIIEYYNIRPADSRWVRDPRYREDPCKQCKKKYVKGDVSLCRWHPKPYCQALPYGPGYWMCCHRSQKGFPGCKLGLHDNHWVPACHSFNRAIHKKAKGTETEEEY